MKFIHDKARLRRAYLNLIAKAIEENGRPRNHRDTKQSFEIHHPIPRSWFPKGSKEADHPDNLIYLTYRQHFIAHLLLAYLSGGGMWAAFWRMCNDSTKRKIPARLYGLAKKEAALFSKEYHTGRKASAETRQKMSKIQTELQSDPEFRKRMSEALKGRVMTDEHKRKISQSTKGRIFSEEHRQRMRESQLGKKLSEETKAKLSAIHKGRIVSQETRDKLSASRKGKPQKMATCAHCGITTTTGNIKRWHGVKCNVITGIIREKAITECPYCGKSGKYHHLKRNHFDNCKHKPAEVA